MYEKILVDRKVRHTKFKCITADWYTSVCYRGSLVNILLHKCEYCMLCTCVSHSYQVEACWI